MSGGSTLFYTKFMKKEVTMSNNGRESNIKTTWNPTCLEIHDV